MQSISYCTTCKGRLWQLKDTLSDNINAIKNINGVDIVLLNYHSDDGLSDYIYTHFQPYLKNQKLKYYRLYSKADYFDMSYAKNIVHCLASGQVLFNLDADNYIGESISELLTLPRNGILLPRGVANTKTSRYGRIGLHKRFFYSLRGYDEAIKGMAGDDGDLITRAFRRGLKPITSQDISVPIQNTEADKQKYTNPDSLGQNYKINDFVNPGGYGIAQVLDIDNNLIRTGRK